jgi:large subunit ribosomal protein L14
MKALPSKMTGGLTIGTMIKVDDNSGVKMLHILGKEKYRGRRGRIPAIGIGDVLFGSVVSGKKDLMKKVMRAVVIRQKKEFRRVTGERIAFEDNACVILTEKNEPQATEIKGVIAKEVAERFPKVATLSRNVI